MSEPPTLAAPRNRRPLLLLFAGTAAAVFVAIVGLSFFREPASPPRKAIAEAPPPTLNCVFYDAGHANIIVAFDFVIGFPGGAAPRFEQRAQASQKGDPIAFDAGQRPVWSYALDEDGAPAITSPDKAIRIVLFALKPAARGVVFVDAGLRSNEYRNLDGKCRQSDFGDSGRAEAFGVLTGDAAEK